MSTTERKLTSELVRLAHELDNLGDFESADLVDSVVSEALTSTASVIDRNKIPELQSAISGLQRAIQLLQSVGASSATLPAAIQELQSIVQYSLSESPASQRPVGNSTRPGKRTGVGIRLN